MESVHQLPQIDHGARQAVEPGHAEDIPLPDEPECCLELPAPLPGRSGPLLLEYLLAPCGLKLLDLDVQALTGASYPGIPRTRCYPSSAIPELCG